MNGPAGFLADRLDEKEAGNREIHEARVCSGCSDGWEAGFDPDRCDCGYPARVLRDVEADRQLLTAYENAVETFSSRRSGLYLAVRIRAERFSGHPGYRQEWAP